MWRLAGGFTLNCATWQCTMFCDPVIPANKTYAHRLLRCQRPQVEGLVDLAEVLTFGPFGVLAPDSASGYIVTGGW